jgi:hypothetical protein
MTGDDSSVLAYALARIIQVRGHRMKTKARLILFLVLFTFSLSAEPKGSAATGSTEPFGPSSESSPMLALAGLGLMNYGGHLGVSLIGDFLFRLTDTAPFYLGFETGLDFLESHRYSWYTAGTASGYVGMPLAVAAMYRFGFLKVPNLHPYAALSMGPYISLSSGRSVVLELVIRPGISWRFHESMALSAEPRFGIIGGGFFACPMASMTFFL